MRNFGDSANRRRSSTTGCRWTRAASSPVVCVVYPRANARTQDLTAHDDVTPDPPAQPRIPRMTAYHILTSWQRPPGSDSSRALDYDRMKAWIDEAQQLLDIQDRREAGDSHIGQVLSAAPPDPSDGIAPPIPIRQLLEKRPTPELEDGLGLGLLMGPTGIKSGWVGELVAESQTSPPRSPTKRSHDRRTLAPHRTTPTRNRRGSPTASTQLARRPGPNRPDQRPVDRHPHLVTLDRRTAANT